MADPMRCRASTISAADSEAALAEADRAERESGGAEIARFMKSEALARLSRLEEFSAEEPALVAKRPSASGIYLANGRWRSTQSRAPRATASRALGEAPRSCLRFPPPTRKASKRPRRRASSP